MGCTISDDAQAANAVLLDLLRGKWITVPLQVVTHDFCNDDVLGALVSRNMVAPVDHAPVASRGSCVVFPDEYRFFLQRMTSDNGRYSAVVCSGGDSSAALRIVTVDNVLCCTVPISLASVETDDCVLRLDAANRSMVCVRASDGHSDKDTALLQSGAKRSDGCSPCSSCQSSTLPTMLVLTDAGELEVRQQRSGSSSVVWSSGNRLIKAT
jgi:hypothetical protein